MHGIELLLANCDRLTILKDLCYFEGVTSEELEKLKTRITKTNLNMTLDDATEENNQNINIDDNFMNFVSCIRKNE